MLHFFMSYKTSVNIDTSFFECVLSLYYQVCPSHELRNYLLLTLMFVYIDMRVLCQSNLSAFLTSKIKSNKILYKFNFHMWITSFRKRSAILSELFWRMAYIFMTRCSPIERSRVTSQCLSVEIKGCLFEFCELVSAHFILIISKHKISSLTFFILFFLCNGMNFQVYFFVCYSGEFLLTRMSRFIISVNDNINCKGNKIMVF